MTWLVAVCLLHWPWNFKRCDQVGLGGRCSSLQNKDYCVHQHVAYILELLIGSFLITISFYVLKNLTIERILKPMSVNGKWNVHDMLKSWQVYSIIASAVAQNFQWVSVNAFSVSFLCCFRLIHEWKLVLKSILRMVFLPTNNIRHNSILIHIAVY